MSAPGPATPGGLPTREARTLAELVTTLQGNLLSIGIGNAVVALAMAIGLWGQAPHGLLAAWLAVQLAHSLFSAWAWTQVRRRPASVRSAPARARASVWASAGSGTLWAASLPLFWPADRLDLQLLMITMITGLVSGAIHSLSAHLRAFHAFFAPNVAMVVGICLWQGGTLHAAIAATALVYGITGARFARAMHEVQRRSIAQRDELAELAADLELQKQRAEQASSAKSRFLAAASHDIRQPVHALNLFLGAFDDRALAGRNAELIGPLRESARGLREMLDGVLDLSRAEAGTVSASPAHLPVQALLDLAERDYAPLAEAKGLVLRTVPTSAAVHADPLLAERVVRNLVSNAVRYTQRGGVLVGARRRGATVAIEVWDTGPGIPESEREAVFQEFSRGEGAAGRERGGLGLGLAIARRFAEAQQGRLTLHSRPGRGSVFRLELPASAPRPAPSAPAAAATPADERLHGLRVLLVDDDAAVRHATAALLDGWGCAVQAIESPDAVAAASPPDVIVTDNDFAGRLRAHEVADAARALAGRALPLVVVTGERRAPNLAPLAEAGAVVLAKPVDPAELRRALARQDGGR